MDSKTYQNLAPRTNNPDIRKIAERLLGTDESHIPHDGALEVITSEKDAKKKIDLLHAAMGLVTESGEFMDMLKKHLFYGKPLDEVNLLEEIGDASWYLAIALNALGSSFEEVMARNIEKLQARYPDKFTEQAALVRNLDKEREILEK
jgi:NTP pyrophosphatase (non-canonical NTP hydrolase)